MFEKIDFILNGGFISIFVACLLILMSVLSWYFIAYRSYRLVKEKKAINEYIASFWKTSNLAEALNIQDNVGMSAMVQRAVSANQHHQQLSGKSSEVPSKDDFVARAINRAIIEKSETLEEGLSVLASIGSIAPFVGLFGTVWGIYHALESISVSGQATLDKVAGPVGEALIMTAIGLAVAIPAVLAYNGFLRANRKLISKMGQFAEELHILITTGAVLQHDSQARKS